MDDERWNEKRWSPIRCVRAIWSVFVCTRRRLLKIVCASLYCRLRCPPSLEWYSTPCTFLANFLFSPFHLHLIHISGFLFTINCWSDFLIIIHQFHTVLSHTEYIVCQNVCQLGFSIILNLTVRYRRFFFFVGNINFSAKNSRFKGECHRCDLRFCHRRMDFYTQCWALKSIKPSVHGFHGTQKFYLVHDYLILGSIWLSSSDQLKVDSSGGRAPTSPLHYPHRNRRRAMLWRPFACLARSAIPAHPLTNTDIRFPLYKPQLVFGLEMCIDLIRRQGFNEITVLMRSS